MDKRNIEAIYPTSPIQTAGLQHALDGSENPTRQLHCELHGDLNVALFQNAWQQVAERYQTVRSFFVWKRVEKPYQVVLRDLNISVEVHDCCEEDLAKLFRSERERGCDLSKAPLMRFGLWPVRPSVYQFIFNYSSLLIDDRSAVLLLEKALEIYEELQKGQPVASSPSSGYKDYVAWLKQRDWSQTRDYWKQSLGKSIFPRVDGLVVQAEHTAVSQVVLPANARERIESFVAANHLRFETLVLGAWALLQSRMNNTAEVICGVRVSGRPRSLAGAEKIVGAFSNLLPLRVNAEVNEPVLSWLKQIQVRCEGLLQHGDTSLDQIQEWTDLHLHSHFESALVWDDAARNGVVHQPSSLSVADLRTVGDLHSPLTIQGLSGPESRLQLTYDTRRFDQDDSVQMLQRTQLVLESLVANPEQLVSTVSILTEAERYQLVVTWNETETEYPRTSCIHELFEAEAARRPQATALIFQDVELSYGELNERANRVAHYLRRSGVRAESRVGICMERSEWMLIGLLGILKAGGAYVPLDPQYPVARLHYMLADAGVQVLLTQAALADRFAGEAVKLLSLDAEWERVAAESGANLQSEVQAANLAYVIYTSGSTGEPKGIGIAHYSVNRLVCNSDYVQVQSDDCIAQASNASFDAATFEIWGALLNGARLCIIPAPVVLSPVKFAAELQREKVTVLFLTTALFNQMAREAVMGFSGLRHLLFGGQAVEPQWVAQVLESGYAGRLLHVYGPTESTTYSTWEEVREVKKGARSIPIGKPLANTTQYVLGADMEVAPVGVVGELYLGGEGLARGYWERPELTAERFVPNPYGKEGGERLYRTGDLVRGVGAGRVEFVGRVDQQVKIRGFRVELEEVGVVLSGAPGVATAVVEVRGRDGGEPRLVGYVVPKVEAALVVSELREYLQERLPAYMVPSVYVELAELPLTVNGKVDRRALPEPEEWGSGEYVGPRTATEEILAGIWASVLKVERVGVTENFFEIGGHSLLATQVVSRIRESFGVDMALRELFEQATIAALAARVDEALQSGTGVLAPPIVKVERSGELPLSFAQQRLWFLDQLEPESAFYNIPSAVRLSGALDREALGRSLSEIVRRHEALRTVFASVEGEPVQVIRVAEPVAIDEVDLSGLAAEEREVRAGELARLEAQTPFDLSRGPLL